MTETATSPPYCVPLCGASKAYGRYDQPWKHEPQCPVRMAWEAAKGIERMIACRVKKGNAEQGSRELLDELLRAHSGDNLVLALIEAVEAAMEYQNLDADDARLDAALARFSEEASS